GPAVKATMTAANTTVQAGAQVSANATGKGDGGRVVVLSGKGTSMAGAIAAKGGPNGGDGGFVEVSGGHLNLSGSADESAPAGHLGTLLLDPSDLDIVANSDASNIDKEFSDNTLLFSAAGATTPPSTITSSKLAMLGVTGDVTVQATGTIDVRDSVTVANGLLLQATGNLLVDRGVTIKSGANTLELDAGFNFSTNNFDQPGAILLGTTGTGAAPQLQAVNLTLHAGTGAGISLNDAILTASAATDISTASGGVSQAAAGSLTTVTLRSTAGVNGNAGLISMANSVGTLGTFIVTGGDFSLVNNGNSGNLAVTGGVAANNVAIRNANTGTISVSGSIGSGAGSLSVTSGSGGIALNSGAVLTGPTIDLNGGTGGIALTGNASVGQSGGVVDLTATAGGIDEATTSTIIAGTLQSSGGVAGAVSLLGTANAIGALANFVVTGGSSRFVLDDSTALTVSGTVTAPGQVFLKAGTTTGITIAATGSVGAGTLASFQADALSNAGAVTAATFELAPFTNGGTVVLGAGGTFASLAGIGPTNIRIGAVTMPDGVLTTTAGSISVGASFGSGAVALELDSNGAISQAPGGVLTAGTLTGSAVGSVDLGVNANAIDTITDFRANGFSVSDGIGLTVAGTIAPASSSPISIALTAPTITITGEVNDGGGTGTTSLIANAGTISETGILISGTLSGSALAAADFSGSTSTTNQVGHVGNFTASGFNLSDGIDVTVTGTLNGGPRLTLLDNGTLTIAPGGTIGASTIGLTASNIEIKGLSNDSGAGTTSLIATIGTISETGTLIAGTLSGSSAGTTSLTGATSITNKVTNLGNFTAKGFTLDDGIGLNVIGTLNAGPSAAVLDTGTLTIGNTVTAAAIALTADNIAIPGRVTDGGAGITNLIATTGTISETGTLIAGTLSGSSAGSTSLTGATSITNGIANIGNFTAIGFTVDDGIGLTVIGALNGGPSVTMLDTGMLTIAAGGSVAAGAIALTANDIAIAGAVADAGTTNLIATTGTISETGVLSADLLTGSAAGDASLAGNGAPSTTNTQSSNRVVQLGSFRSGGTLTLNNGTDLTIAGPLTAPTINIDAGPSQITLADRAVITTGGIRRPSGTFAEADFPPAPRFSTQGAYLTTSGGFTQHGTSTTQGIGGGANILRINALGSANIVFDPFLGLQGAQTWLILQIGSGRAIGQAHVQNLDVLTNGGQAGASNLTGSVTGLSGPAAAGVAGIAPSPNNNFRFNQCQIASVSCILLPGEAVPTANPLNDIDIGRLFNPNQDEDLLLPIVSDQDY
ncbi:MAG TPA: hypothetical protein VFL55_07155, partial [Acetobacteraceae bacterium]|nr:hypothetical protein [Acetobacteraceae bacterium]